MSDLKFNNDFLDQYLDMVEDTESPRIFHIWAALSGVAACLGRRVFLQRGHKQLYSNLYISLVGPPGVRKSTAMDIMKDRLSTATGVRFAPDDTAGQRQGLIKALQNEVEDEEAEELLNAIQAGDEGSLDKLMNRKVASDFDPRDKHTLFVCASEFNSFLGNNASDMLTFLIKMYDGDNYKYRLKNEELSLEQPLMNIIGCTTPTNISTALPPEAIGQGFMSRVILVYSNKKYKSIPDPKAFDKKLVSNIEDCYRYFFYELDGEMGLTPSSKTALAEMYEEKIKLDDPRFVYYVERRHTHLIKLSMLMAASRMSKVISVKDIQEASAILRATELAMPDALGEYGLSKVSVAKQKLIEFLQHVQTAVSAKILFAVMARDMTFQDFSATIADLQNAGKIKQVQTKDGAGYVYIDSKQTLIDEVLAELIEQEEGGEEQMPAPNVVPMKIIK